MNFNKSLTALAVAGIIAAPMAAQADSGFYGSVRVGLENISSDDATAEGMKIRNHASRFGFAGEADIGGGTSGYGKYEVGYGPGGISQRHQYVGLKGGFGDFRVISQGYTAFYNHVENPLDLPWWNGVSSLAGNGRNKNAVNYEGGAGAFKFGIAVEADGTETSQSGTEFAGSFDAGPIKIGLGVKDKEAYADAINGVTVSGNFGSVGLGVGIQTAGDAESTVMALSFGSVYVLYSLTDSGTGAVGAEPSVMSVGYTHDIGAQTQAWFEYATFDNDDGADEDSDEIHAVLKFNWN